MSSSHCERPGGGDQRGRHSDSSHTRRHHYTSDSASSETPSTPSATPLTALPTTSRPETTATTRRCAEPKRQCCRPLAGDQALPQPGREVLAASGRRLPAGRAHGLHVPPQRAHDQAVDATALRPCPTSVGARRPFCPAHARGGSPHVRGVTRRQRAGRSRLFVAFYCELLTPQSQSASSR